MKICPVCHIQYDDSRFACEVCKTRLVVDEEWKRDQMEAEERAAFEKKLANLRQEEYDLLAEQSVILSRKLKALSESDPSLLRIIPYRFLRLEPARPDSVEEEDIARIKSLVEEMTTLLDLIRSFNINLRKLKNELYDACKELEELYRVADLELLVENAASVEHNRERIEPDRMAFLAESKRRVQLLRAFVYGGSFSYAFESFEQTRLEDEEIVTHHYQKIRVFRLYKSLRTRIRNEIAATTPNIGQCYLLFREDMRREKELLLLIRRMLNKSIEKDDGRIRYRYGIEKSIPYMATMTGEKVLKLN